MSNENKRPERRQNQKEPLLDPTTEDSGQLEEKPMRRVTDRFGDQRRKPGALLIEAIRQRIVAKGISAAEAAEECGLGYKYFTALMAGDRSFASLKHDNFRLIARFLRTSVVQVMVWAEAIGLEDFHTEEDIFDLLEASFVKMRKDQKWGALLPPVRIWDEAATEIKIAMVLMYEKLAERTLLEKVKVGRVVDSEEILQGLAGHAAVSKKQEPS